MKSAIKPLARREREARILPVPLCWSLQGELLQALKSPTIAASVLRSGGAGAREPSGGQSWVLGRRRVVQALLSLGKAARSLIGWDGPGGWPEVTAVFPTIFNVNVFFLAPYLRVPQLDFGFLLEGIAAYVAVPLECTWETGKSASSYDAFSVQNPISASLVSPDSRSCLTVWVHKCTVKYTAWRTSL